MFKIFGDRLHLFESEIRIFAIDSLLVYSSNSICSIFKPNDLYIIGINININIGVDLDIDNIDIEIEIEKDR